MSSLHAAEQAYETALAERRFGPGIVLMAVDKTGDFQYVKELGRRSWTDPQSAAFDQHTVMRLASCTKLMTSVAALQCVEHGLLSLDGDLAEVLPRLRGRQVVSLGADGKVEHSKQTEPITLRQLLTHTSGMSYSFFEPSLQAWAAATGYDFGAGRTLLTGYDYPLSFQPGTSWMYGLGLDWAGEAIRTVTGLALDEYMARHVWAPLGIAGMTFWPQADAALSALVPDVCERDAATGAVRVASADRYNAPAQEPMGGGGAQAQPAEYMKVLASLLRDDGKLLRPATAAQLFEPQLPEAPRQALRALLRGNEAARRGMARGIADEGIVDHGLGGLVQTEALPGYRGRNSLMWGGLPNLTWFVDRERGLCGMTAAQMIPPSDELLVDLGDGWERGLYERYGEWEAGRT